MDLGNAVAWRLNDHKNTVLLLIDVKLTQLLWLCNRDTYAPNTSVVLIKYLNDFHNIFRNLSITDNQMQSTSFNQQL